MREGAAPGYEPRVASRTVSVRQRVTQLETHQRLTLKLSLEALEELGKFYLPEGKTFRRALFRSDLETETPPFSTSAIMMAGAIDESLETFSAPFAEVPSRRALLASIRSMSAGVLARYQRPRTVYRTTASAAFGDLNPLTASFVMRHLLRGYRSGADVPLALRVSTRIALAYLVTQFWWDEARIRPLFGAASLWSRPVNHPLVVFRCVEALSELLRRSGLAANGSEWLGACVAPLTARERRAILMAGRMRSS